VSRRVNWVIKPPGAEHPVHICLPPGHYVPKLIHACDLETARGASTLDEKRNGRSLDGLAPHENGGPEGKLVDSARPFLESNASQLAEQHEGSESRIKFRPRIGVMLGAAIFALSVVVLIVFVWREWNRNRGHESPS
jgi:hypothetical protein